MQYPRKISFSRKGFDSASGGFPSPIMPDGTLLSLPIPDSGDYENKYGDLTWDNRSLAEIIQELNPNSPLVASSHCHLDPDLRAELKPRLDGWIPAFGQHDGRVTHLDNQGFDVGDLFLFFGLFRQTEYHNGRLRFVPSAPNQHILFGYLQVAEIIRKEEDVPDWLKTHPHSKHSYWYKKNALYIASDKLSFLPHLSGSGCFDFRQELVLTKPGYSCSRWQIPDGFRSLTISNASSKSWHSDYLQLPRGQEYVFTPTSEVMEWVGQILA